MNLKIKDVAKLMNVSEQYIRIGLQRELLPIGNAVQNPGGRYSYYISPKLLEEFTGIKVETKEEKQDTKKESESNMETTVIQTKDEITIKFNNATLDDLKQSLINKLNENVGRLSEYSKEIELLEIILKHEKI